MSNARTAALEALLHVDENEGYSNIVIDKTIKASDLSQKDASLATAIFYGVLERRIKLDYIISKYSKLHMNNLSAEVLNILRIALYQILFLKKIPYSAAVNEAVNCASQSKKTAKAKGYINGILRTVVRNVDHLPMPDERRSPMKAWSVESSVPEWILSLWCKSYGMENAEKMVKQIQEKSPIYARVNTTETTADKLIEKLTDEGVTAQKSNICEDALILNKTGAVDNLKCFKKGLFHVQDLSSQLCCMLLDPQPGETVADLCAAPGGKTFTMAELMEDKGKLLAFDKYKGKVGLIRQGAERLNLHIIKAMIRDSLNPEEELLEADRVLCDAPCSGLGIIGRKPEIRYKDPETIKELPKIQHDILAQAARQVKSGGILAYSTCSLNPAENGDIADSFLEEHSDFEPLEIKLPQGVKRGIKEPSNQLTLLPHINNTDGFFIALFKKR